MMQGFHPFPKNETVFQKTVAINDFYFGGPATRYPLGQIQSQGRTHGVMAQIVVPWIPLWAYDAWVARGVDWLVMSEDLPRAENRVTVDASGRIQLRYRPNNVRPHALLVEELKRILRRLGFWVVITHSHGSKNTTHQCGTLCFGTDPRTSVLDPFCRTHDVENLFVVDASFFPSSAAVNPGADDRGAGAAGGRSHQRHRPLVAEPPVKARSFSHVGITVSDFNRAVQFYWEVFGCPLVGVADTPPERVRSFFGVDARRADAARSAGFACPAAACSRSSSSSRSSRPAAIPWNRVGLTHISFNVRNLQKWYDYLVSKGVECVSKPERSPRGHSFFFVRDFDGNLIELMDLGYMYHVLGWLGPLGGWIFRRGMYRQYLRVGAEGVTSFFATFFKL